MEFVHKSVLFDECMEILSINPDGLYADGTLGGGGHSLGIVQRLENGRLIGIDRDRDALDAAGKRLKEFEDKITLVQSNYADIKRVFSEKGIEKADGILLDLGVSSYQLDNPERGFSYMNDAPLDMRMNRNDEFSAYDVVNTYSESELCRIITEYGEERWAKRIAEFIVAARKEKPVSTTFELTDIIKAAVPKGARRDGPHPAKRTFQAIRIEVNGELEKLKGALSDMIDVLGSGGVLAVITFHSLEDRIVKEVFAQAAKGCTCPRELPVCVCGKKPIGKPVTRKPILPSQQELEENPRSRSAKLRAFVKF